MKRKDLQKFCIIIEKSYPKCLWDLRTFIVERGDFIELEFWPAVPDISQIFLLEKQLTAESKLAECCNNKCKFKRYHCQMRPFIYGSFIGTTKLFPPAKGQKTTERYQIFPS